MSEIFLIPQILEQLREKVSRQATNNHDPGTIIHITNYEPVVRALDNYFKQDNENWELKIKTCARTLGVKFVKEETSDPYHTFIKLCQYLELEIEITPLPTKAKKNRYKYSRTVESIIDELREKSVIKPSTYDEQIAIWQRGKAASDEQYYSIYSASANDDVSIGVATLNFKTFEASLRLTTNDKQTEKGSFKNVDGNIFVHFPISVNGFESFMSLVRDEAMPIQFCEKFRGYYCGAIIKQNGSPLATMVVLSKIEMPFAGDFASLKPNAETVVELSQQILQGHRKIEPEHYDSLCGFYDGYWLVKGTKLNIIRFSLNIMPGGKCEIKGPNRPIFKGNIIEILPDTLLKIGFGAGTGPNIYLLQIIFDLSDPGKGFYDGVYSGRKPDEFHIMAGRIRIYPTDTEIKPEKIVVTEFEVLQPKDQTLISFLVGNTEGLRSQSYVEPSAKTFNTLYPPLIDNVSEIEQFDGSYTIIRLDSKKQTINRYHVVIKKGVVEYEMIHKNKTRKYTGVASFLEGCLTLNIFKRSKAKYNALYIFFIGGRKSSDYKYIKGIYATSALPGVPYCGRAIMEVGFEKGNNKPVEIFGEEYFKLDKEMRTLLTGVENNMIKVNTEINDLSREFNYGEIFFSYACLGVDELSDKITFLRQSLYHNFDDIEYLKSELQPNRPLELIAKNKLIEITPDCPKQDFYQVELIDLKNKVHKFIIQPTTLKKTRQNWQLIKND